MTFDVTISYKDNATGKSGYLRFTQPVKDKLAEDEVLDRVSSFIESSISSTPISPKNVK